ncbi:hypothetical protein BDV97DRAFT_370300 [Delphinella strobiligena]|nr:hypothetical protein BDV97DRAFT_370300 [Delphinella strobiligena]
MKVLYLRGPDGQSHTPSLSLDNIAMPRIKAGEVLIKIRAAGINPSDKLNAAGGFPYTTYPRVPGRDFAGTVVDGHPNMIGCDVFGTSGRSLGFTRDGTHAEFCVVSEASLAEKPSSISFVQAATIGVPFTTAAICLRRGHVQPADVVLVLGATGSVGTAVAQLALTKGCKVITASRQDGSHVNILHNASLSKVKELTGGKGPDVVVDTTGDPALMQAALGVLSHGGRLVFIAAPRSGSTDFSFDMKSLYRQEQSIVGCNSLSYSIEDMAAELRVIAPLFQSGQLVATAEDQLTKFDLESAINVYKASSRAKCVIEFI